MPITLGLRQYVVIAVAFVLVLTVMGIALYPALYLQYIQEIGIKRFETEYGFKSGTIAMNSPTIFRLSITAGAADMYAALQQADAGQATSFQVYNAGDAHLGRSALRTIQLPASRER